MSSDLNDPPPNQFTRHGASPPIRERDLEDRRAPGKHFTLHPDSYDGSTEVESFIRKFEIVAKHNQWNQGEKIVFLQCSLHKEAQNLLWEYGASPDIIYGVNR